MACELDPGKTSVPDGVAVPADRSREEGASLERVLPELVAQVYEDADLPLRARLLRCMLRPLGPLGLVSVAAGAFGMFLQREAWQRLREPVSGSLRFSADQIRELASFVAQIQPEAFAQLPAILVDPSFGARSAKVALLNLALQPLVRECEANR